MITGLDLAQVTDRMSAYYNVTQQALSVSLSRLASGKNITQPSDGIADYFRIQRAQQDRSGYQYIGRQLDESQAMMSVADNSGTSIEDALRQMKQVATDYWQNQSAPDVQQGDVISAWVESTTSTAGRAYFGAFAGLITRGDDEFRFGGRTRRPPLDPVNAMLSFAYAILAHDTRSACEAVGLDPQVGFLHRDRPGRPGLALDLMEELRAPVADRAVLTVINRRQVSRGDFEIMPGGGVRMGDAARKALLTTYQKRKQEEVLHPFLGERTTVGLIPHLQARLLARHLRGALDGYPPYFLK